MNVDNRVSVVCTHEGAVAPYRWGMNGDDFYSPFLLATSGQIPTGAWLADQARRALEAAEPPEPGD